MKSSVIEYVLRNVVLRKQCVAVRLVFCLVLTKRRQCWYIFFHLVVIFLFTYSCVRDLQMFGFEKDTVTCQMSCHYGNLSKSLNFSSVNKLHFETFLLLNSFYKPVILYAKRDSLFHLWFQSCKQLTINICAVFLSM